MTTAILGVFNDMDPQGLLETVVNILYMRLSLVTFVGDDVQKTAIVQTLCMYLRLCVRSREFSCAYQKTLWISQRM